MGIVIHQDDLAPGVQPLSPEELRWIKSLERVLKRMPHRLLLIEIGDSIDVVDREAARGVPLEDGNAGRSGVKLGSVTNSAFVLRGVSG